MPRRKSTKQKTAKRGPGRPKGSTNKPKTDGRSRAGRLTTMSTADLAAELERRQANSVALVRKRDEIAAELNAVNAELSALGMAGNGAVTTGKRGRGRPKGSKNKTTTTAKKSTARRGPHKRPQNSMTLVEALRKTLNNKTMSVAEVSQAVQDVGYKTSSKNFRTIVNLALIQHPDAFKKVARGQYTTK